MRVLALGGGGAMGAVAVRTAAGLAGVSEIVVADRDLAAAQLVSSTLTAETVPVRAERVDITDPGELRAALDAADVVLNTVGPYYEFGVGVLGAAIETGTHYLDICDDWEPTLEMLELDERARAAGVCAVIGMGASPGVSNLLALAAAREFEVLRDIYTAWPVDAGGMNPDMGELVGPQGRPSAAAVHWMQQLSGTVAQVGDGRIVRRRPLRAVRLDLPGGLGGTAYTCGHPEPVTLHRTLRPTGESANLMVVRPSTAAYLDSLRRDLDAGRLTNAEAAALVAAPGVLRGLRAAFASLWFASPRTLPPFFAVATGTRERRAETVLARLPAAVEAFVLTADMATVTGVPLALGLSQVIDGGALVPGVRPPEAVIEPRRFFTDLAAHLGLPESGDVILERA
ncbi:saccharopine dehydrogenase family protein [Nocardia sp. NPDC057668]|uniref:saccharopine dehydrogenase family protein n=1 Tax=Nocardia sp. NPDC057668 TaxID=3346202 RepID=UPI00366D2CA1